MANKIYEAETLLSTMEERVQQYNDLKDQLTGLKKEFTNIVNLDDSFQGQGAEAVKGFFQAQIEVVDAWIRLIDRNVAFFNGIPGSASDLSLSGDTVVQVPFLEDELPNAYQRANNIVTAQQDDLQKIFNTIDDLVPLNVFSREAFDEHIDRAEKKRKETIEKVNTFDQELKSEYESSENEEIFLNVLFSNLLESSSKGGTVSPLYFDVHSYKSSEVYKLTEEANQQTKDYLTFKKDQGEARRIEKEMEELENRPWYEKTWDTVATFTGEVTGYYDFKRSTEGVDPVTGRKLSTAERVTAGAMAAAGFIPIVGWAGRAFKGGRAIYSTAKGFNAASHALDAYKNARSFSVLQQTEMGIYGLVAANGLSEAATGKDMFGNTLTEEQRQNSLLQALGIGGVAGTARFLDHRASKGVILPYSNQNAQKVVEQGKQTISNLGNRIGQIQMPVKIRVQSVSSETGIKVNVYGVEKKSISEMVQRSSNNSVNTKDNSKQSVNNELTMSTKSKDNHGSPYTGVKEASQFLISEGVPRRFRKQILESFDIRTIKMAVADQNTYGLRFYDNVNASAKGRYLFETFTHQTNRRNLALPPEWNGMTGIQQWKIRPDTTIIKGDAGPQFEQGNQYIGGSEQWYINNLEDLIKP
ncbi:T7SS effector LXG polymorphic toxin [Bacillus sp. CECT 9360]|uniref:ribonuclease YeeF family protein n=1 Tax=Bacillus sp. CECT 9360 TaxID=2845821 RepID=UPI001E638225|nr:T7SS effector LXG polymorphic toxin [Bacillus sp. CECT 9360]CAH0345750.1 hypothetical protein BCI9360_02048 [Bacillus sp. CECT 9360]